jgi:NAD(P)-dependent dehydrogenase (short-subunit alcohol dehydrogenase family)
VIIVDVTKPVVDTAYTLASAEDHAETVRQVEALDRRILAIDADVRDQAALDAAVTRGISELGKIDILIANAGIWTQNPFWELTEQQWDEMIGVNLTGVWKAAKAVAPHMIERKSGSIVITSSVNGLEPGPNYAHYVAAKHGVRIAPHGVRCNSINPGAILTPMTNHQGAWDMFAGHEGGTHEEMIAGGYHYGVLRGSTWLEPEAIANTALYLNSALAANVTGVTIPVDSGHLLIPGVNTAPVRD